MIINELFVYEVRSYNYNPNYPLETFDNVDYDYIVCDGGNDETMHDVIKAAIDHLENVKVEVHLARSGNVIFNKDHSFWCDDCDTATGYHGSPVHEIWFDAQGRTFTADDEGVTLFNGEFIAYDE